MGDLIDRQVAIDALERKKDKNAKGDIGGFYNKIIQNDIDALIQLPSVQPEIIRCKDCKYNTSSHKCLQPDSFFLVPADDFYCGYAERRADGV